MDRLDAHFVAAGRHRDIDFARCRRVDHLSAQGAHMVGAEVTEMIQGFAIGKTLETTERELMQTVFPHPTISESMHESVLAAHGIALHI